MNEDYKKLYLQQLKTGCKKSVCSKVFCRKMPDEITLDNVANILSMYEELFLCRNVHKLFNASVTYKDYCNYGFWCLDMMFYYLDSIINNKCPASFDKSIHKLSNLDNLSPYFFEDKDPNKNQGSNVLRNLTNRNNGINIEKKVNKISISPENSSNVHVYHHTYCKFFNKGTYSEEEMYVLTSVLQIILKNYDKKNSHFLGLICIRLFNVIEDLSFLDVQYLSLIHKIVYNIHNLSNSKCKRTSPMCNNFYVLHNKTEKLHGDSVNKDDSNIGKNNFNSRNNSIIREKSMRRQLGTKKKYKTGNEDINSGYVNDCYKYPIYPDKNNSCLCSLDTNDENSKECYKNLVVYKNSNYLCIDEQTFGKQDLINLVNTVSRYLNSLLITDMRENKKVETMLNIFNILYLLNENMQALGYKRFYLPTFCSRINFREEFKFYRAKSKTPLNFSFILPVHVKAELIKAENNDMMKASLQDSFFRSLFEGHIEPYLFITVNREHIYKDSFDILKKLKIEDVRKQLRITFINEEGVDSGGIRKEFFQLLSQDIKNDERLFNIKENTNIVWFKDGCYEESYYISIGKILGIALYNNVVLNIPFPSVFFKKLLNKNTNFYDLKEIEPEIFTSLSNLKKLSKEEIENLDLTFTISYESSEGLKFYNLNEGGEEIKVTKNNLDTFASMYADFYINKLNHTQFEAIKKGFYFVIEKDTLVYLDSKELEKIIMGSNEFDLGAIKSTTTYSGYTSETPIIQYFWEIFGSFNKKTKKKLLQFITGNDRIPVAGSSSLKLIIMKNGCDTDRLPSSQTCFNTLLLPEYATKEKFERKLRTALEMTAGFFLL